MRDIMTKLTAAPRFPQHHFYPKPSIPTALIRIAIFGGCLYWLVRL